MELLIITSISSLPTLPVLSTAESHNHNTLLKVYLNADHHIILCCLLFLKS